ncbi:T3SS component [Citrobacter rodentium ICC168]|uniref:T3SS component n=2 Tax=Citrobacter rodentium TaxID=67825 RepID=D2TKH1_CITRI|nr:T3SS component [Citrobacter rodentium ICC168]
MVYFLINLIKFYCLMKLYEYKNIKIIDLVLTEDVVAESKLQEIFQTDNIIKLTRKRTCEHLLRIRRKTKQLKIESRKKIAKKMLSMRERERKYKKIKLEKEINNSVKWVKDIQDIELVLIQDIMNKIHLTLTDALHSLDTSSRINWDALLNEVVREAISHNNIVGAIKITKNPDVNIDLGEGKNLEFIDDLNIPVNQIIIENEYIRITLDPLEQINILLNSFKESYLSIIQE